MSEYNTIDSYSSSRVRSIESSCSRLINQQIFLILPRSFRWEIKTVFYVKISLYTRLWKITDLVFTDKKECDKSIYALYLRFGKQILFSTWYIPNWATCLYNFLNLACVFDWQKKFDSWKNCDIYNYENLKALNVIVRH